MTLSPTVRAVLTVVVVALTAFSAALPSFTDVPGWVGVAIASVLAGLGALGLVPPQTGGTQVGVASPTVVEPPAAKVEEAAAPNSSFGV